MPSGWSVLGVSALPLLVVFVALDRLGGTGTNTVPSPVGPYNIWEQVLARIEEAIQPRTYFAFFRDTVLVSDDGVIIRFGAGAEFGCRRMDCEASRRCAPGGVSLGRPRGCRC